MALQIWDPFRDVLSLRDAMDRLFESSFVRPWAQGTIWMPLDVEETDNEYVVHAVLPGFSPEDVNVTVSGDTLTIRAEHRPEEGKTYLVREIPRGTVTRTITFPAAVEGDQAHAEYVNGELVLTIPKAEEVRPKQIKINVDEQKQLAAAR